MFTLTWIAATIWGVGLLRAMEVYTKVIRTAIAHGAAIPNSPDPASRRESPAEWPANTKCLRMVAGAYKSTTIAQLETETAVPPLDLRLNKPSKIACGGHGGQDPGDRAR